MKWTAANRSFKARTMKADGPACATLQTLAALQTCACEKDLELCDAQVANVTATRQFAKFTKGTDATIQACSHSFDWVSVRISGEPQQIWTNRMFVLD